MIIAAGLTPAWQQIMRFDGFQPGEVNRALDVQWCASGKVLNVGIALAHLGAPSETIALVGGPTGQQIDREFTSLGIRHQWVPAHWSTRVCTTILDVASGRATELVENAGPATAAELEHFHQAFVKRAADARMVILSGSLPRGAPSTYFRDLLADTHAQAILDFRGPALLAAVERPVFLVKPNRQELAATLGQDLTDDARLHAAMRYMNDLGSQWVVVTDGPRAAWASCGQGLYRFDPPQLVPVNPIGAGDCLAAAFAWGILNGDDPLTALRLGIAAAAQNVEQLLPARLDPELVRARGHTIAHQRFS